MKIVRIPTPRLCAIEEITPADRSVGERVFESVVARLPFEQSSVPLFDELPDKVSKSMDVPPEANLRLDNLDKAQSVIDYFGDKVDAIRVSREAAEGGKGSKADDPNPDNGEA